MKPVVKQAASVEARPVERGEKAFIQVLIGPEDGAPHFILRKFTLLPGGRIPKHRHPTLEHEQYVLSGRMKVTLGDEVREVAAGRGTRLEVLRATEAHASTKASRARSAVVAPRAMCRRSIAPRRR